jgi:hypothetical protein
VLAAHADWSSHPRKRWVAVARRQDQGWTMAAPRPAGPDDAFLPGLLAQAEGAPAVLGVDLPLGVPRAFIPHAQADDFVAFLRGLDRPGWERFFDVAATLDQVSPHRPFYPARGVRGMTRLSHAEALGFADASGLGRACDRATAERPAGAPLFWTLGANQSGKAAIAAWQGVLLPALRAGLPIALWPFQGRIADLLAPGRIVLAETYPAEALRHAGLKLAGSKRAQAGRASVMAALGAAMRAARITPSAALGAAMSDAFGTDDAAEDRFDCVIGLMTVIAVLDGRRPDFVPDDPVIRRWEGWVLGQTALPKAGMADAFTGHPHPGPLPEGEGTEDGECRTVPSPSGRGPG